MIKLPIEKIHIELTNRCNARCPQCTRTRIGINKFIDLPLNYLKNVVESKYTNLKELIYCGNYGDPLMSPYFMDIVENIMVPTTIHTNGSIRSKSDWKKLGFLKHLTMMFHIDGDENTNSIYRIGTVYEKIMRNAHEYINSGGKAIWVFIPFKHNIDNMNNLSKLAKNMGFLDFEIRDSYRVGDGIEPVKITPLIKRKKCKLEESEVYISTEGKVYPCCWVGSEDYKETYRPESFDLRIKSFMNGIKYDYTCFRKCGR
tara:strand:- start:498 stop:1271 length:774 start_codon:yes stop_codon:yes gene_type:complete